MAMQRKRLAFALSVLAVGAVLVSLPPPAGAVSVVTRVQAGSSPQGVAVDPATGRVFVANFGGNVSVLDGRASPVTPVIGSPVGAGSLTQARGVAVDPATGRAFVAGQGFDNVTVLDGRASPVTTVIGSPVAAGDQPFGVAVDPATGRVFVANAGSDDVTVLDGRASPVTPVIGSPVGAGSSPRYVAVDPATGRVFVVNVSGPGNVTVLDGRASPVTPVTGSPVGAGSNPRAVAVDPATGRVFVATSGSDNVTVLDGRASPPAPVAGSPVPAGDEPFNVAIDPTTGRVFVANIGSDDISVIDAATLSVVETVEGVVDSVGFTGAADPVSGQVFFNEATGNSLVVLRDEAPFAARRAIDAHLDASAAAINANVDAAEAAIIAAVNAAPAASHEGITESILANTNAARDSVNANVDAAEAAVLAAVTSARDLVNANVDALEAKVDQLSSKVGNNTRAFCAEGSVRRDSAGTLQMYVTLFSETSQTVRIDYITNKGTFGHDQELSSGVRHTDDANAFLTGPGGPLSGQGDVDTSVRVTAPSSLFLACPVYFNRNIGAAGPIFGGTVQDGSHN